MKEKQGWPQRKSQQAKASFLSALTAPEALLPQDLEVEDASSVEDNNLSMAADPSEEFIKVISGIEWRGIMRDALSDRQTQQRCRLQRPSDYRRTDLAPWPAQV